MLRLKVIILHQTNFAEPNKFLVTGQIFFSTSPTDLGRNDTVKHNINLTDDVPFKDPFRRVPTALYEEVRQHLKEMLEAGAIRPLKSPYSSNVVLVRKKDGSLHFV